VSGSTDIASGASRVHNTKPSERGAPDATPRLNGLPGLQLCARAERSKAGAAIKTAPAPAAPAIKRRRLRWFGKDLFGMIDLRIRLRWINIFAQIYDILTGLLPSPRQVSSTHHE
jgi:hypothetical protein